MQVEQVVQQFLDQHRCQTTVQEILDRVRKSVPHQKFINHSAGETHLVRLYHPLNLRQEAFIGNVLFNAYLGMQAQEVLERDEATECVSVFQDLESFYFLFHTTRTLEELQERILKAWEDGLEELYFSEPSDQEEELYAARGYYGKFSTMLENYFKSNIQPFPLMIVPRAYAEKLEVRIRTHLLQKLESGAWKNGIANFTANFSYFYGQTSGGSGDVQSCPNFLRRLVADYQVLDEQEMNLAFQLSDGTDYTSSETKTLIQQKLFAKGNEPAFYEEKVEQVLKKALQHFGHSIEQHKAERDEPSEWLLRYHREKRVFLDCAPEELLRELVSGATFGGRPFVPLIETQNQSPCLICSYHPARLHGATIIGTDSFSKFHNHSINRGATEHRICYNCALYAYLNIKLSGSKGGGMGQVPRNGNVVFHYGSYSSEELGDLFQRFHDQMDYLTSTGRTEWESEPEEELFEVIEVRKSQVQSMRSMFRRHDGMQGVLLPIRFGEQKLIVFVLPGLQDDVQNRLDVNWYGTLTMLSWLYKLGNREGNTYYLTIPQSKHLGDDRPSLYVKGRQFDAEEQIRLYECYQTIVPELSKSRAKGGFKHEMIIAEQVQRDPYGTFSSELRGWMAESQMNTKQYKLSQFLSAIEQLVEQGEGNVEKGSEKERLHDCIQQIIHALDLLGLLALTLTEKPHRYEKWARDLISPFKRKGTDVDAVFAKWQTRVLREVMYSGHPDRVPVSENVRQKRLEVLGQLQADCEGQYKDLFHKYANQMLNSLLAKVIGYLHPILTLCRSYTYLHLQEDDFFTEEAIERNFESDVHEKYVELNGKSLAREEHLVWAKEHMLMYSHYYKGFKTKEFNV